MQKMTHEPMRVPQVPDGGGAQDDGLDLMRIFAVARRRWPVLLLGLLAGLLLGIAYAATATPVYTASAHISVGSADAENARELSGVSGVRLDEDQITTEIQVLRSEQIAARVVAALDLVQDPAFLSEPRTGPGRAAEGVKALLRLAAAAAVSWVQDEPPAIPLTPQELAEAARQDAVSLLRDNVSVRQVQRSRVLQITYTSVSPALSARIANAVANAYIEDQLASKYEATQRATNWLKERSDQLRLQSGLLDKAVDSFRRENNLAGAGGDLSSDIELELLNKQVADLRAELLALQARSNRLHEIVAQNDTSAFVSSTASQSITANLRSQYLETLRDFNYLRSSLGANHAQTRRRQRELIQLEGLMFEEIKRSEVVARNDVHEARERLASLEAAQTAAAAQLGADNTTLVELREMERNAGTVRSLYTSFLQRYQQSLQEQSFPVSDARILNPARVPQYPSSPQLAKVTALAGILGCCWRRAGALCGRRWTPGCAQKIRSEISLGWNFWAGWRRFQRRSPAGGGGCAAWQAGSAVSRHHALWRGQAAVGLCRDAAHRQDEPDAEGAAARCQPDHRCCVLLPRRRQNNHRCQFCSAAGGAGRLGHADRRRFAQSGPDPVAGGRY
ncbi:hypothetical protein ETW23_23510 (plasmid) [Leisingera sp. NJS201]|nr:hypothetical protein ETW23_23510 [Leisingera sp. NJS201]